MRKISAALCFLLVAYGFAPTLASADASTPADAFTSAGAFTSADAAPNLPPHYVISARGAWTQGGLLVLALTPNTKLYLDDALVPQAGGFAAFGFGRDAPLHHTLRFTRSHKSQSINIALVAREYKVQRIEGVPPKYVDPPATTLARIRREGVQKRAARNTFYDEAWFAQGFTSPRQGIITGVYGSQRFYNGKPRRPHYGQDIAAAAGAPVRAAARGTITLAEADMYFEGGLIFINHGLNITSAYLHLQKVLVQTGDFVEAGDIIGEVGARGRATGAHLDWRVFWQNAHIDPSLLLLPQ